MAKGTKKPKPKPKPDEPVVKPAGEERPPHGQNP